MSSYNRVTLIGNLTRQPELRKTKNGTAVTDLGLALNRVWNAENGERQEETTFVDVTVWGRTAENAAKYLQKGRSVLVEGRLHMDSWQDKETGQDRTRLKVVADAVQFLGAHQESGHGSGQTSASPSGHGEELVREDPPREERRPDDRRGDDRRTDSRKDRRYEAA
jgi:single-strand DNA-binding protein